MSLYSEYFYNSEVNAIFSDNNSVTKMLCFEASLAESQSKVGIISKAVASNIISCCNFDEINISKIKSEVYKGGNAAIPLVNQLTQLVKYQNIESAKFVHLGATSQDVIDTAIVLQIKEYISWLETKLTHFQQILIEITKKHRETIMVGRTLLQQARPITFGLKTAKWLASIKQDIARLQETKKRILVITLGGAVGAGNEFINKKVKDEMAKNLGINSDQNPSNFVEFTTFLGILTGNLGKIAKDISMLMQTEIGELSEGGSDDKGGSSTMPHKRNPVLCTAILANASRVPNLVATMLSNILQEQERSAGLWHAQWEVLSDTSKLAAGTLANSIELLENLKVNSDKMAANLEITNGLIYAEKLSLALAEKIGKAEAHEKIEKACKSAIYIGKHLKEIVIEMGLNLPNIDELFKPENSLGNSLEIIDEILNY